MELTKSNSLLAKLMAKENLHIEQSNVSTASFDVEKRILTLPILNGNMSPDLYDLFMSHEVGHALYTPLDGMSRAYEAKYSMSVMNVLEDSRIERKIKTSYPGVRAAFIRGYRELMQQNFFGVKPSEMNDLSFIDRVNLYCKLGADSCIKFNAVEKALIAKIETTQTYDDVMEVYKEVSRYMKMQKKKNKNQQAKSEPSPQPQEINQEEIDPSQFSDMHLAEQDEESEGDKQPSSDSESTNEEQDNSDNEEEPSSVATPTSKEKDEDDSVDEEKLDEIIGGKVNRTDKEPEEDAETYDDEDLEDEEEPVSETDQNYRDNEHKLFDGYSRPYTYGNIPKLDMSEIVIDHKIIWKRFDELVNRKYTHITPEVYYNESSRLLKIFRNEVKPIVSYLVKEFELKKNAEQSKRNSTSTSGELDMDKIFGYKFNEDLFKKMTIIPGGKSHGLVMFLDWSGSMQEHMNGTIKQLLTLTMFCKSINIPFEVYAFTSQYRGTSYNGERWLKLQKNDMFMSGEFNLMTSVLKQRYRLVLCIVKVILGDSNISAPVIKLV